MSLWGAHLNRDAYRKGRRGVWSERDLFWLAPGKRTKQIATVHLGASTHACIPLVDSSFQTVDFHVQLVWGKSFGDHATFTVHQNQPWKRRRLGRPTRLRGFAAHSPDHERFSVHSALELLPGLIASGHGLHHRHSESLLFESIHLVGKQPQDATRRALLPIEET